MFRTYLELLSFENVSIGTTRLSGTAGDGGVETASSELRLKKDINLGVLLPGIQVALSVVGELHGLAGLGKGRLAPFGDGLSVLQTEKVQRV
jgi:hypothetical protein